MSGKTLTLKRNQVEEAEEAKKAEVLKINNVPVFNPKKYHGEVRGIPGAYYVQGKHLFNRRHQYVGPAPTASILQEPTHEVSYRSMESSRTRKFGSFANTPSVPQDIANIERENARALAAEQHAE